jgi:hypothetical protein
LLWQQHMVPWAVIGLRLLPSSTFNVLCSDACAASEDPLGSVVAAAAAASLYLTDTLYTLLESARASSRLTASVGDDGAMLRCSMLQAAGP